MDNKNPININNLKKNKNKNIYIYILFVFVVFLVCLYIFNKTTLNSPNASTSKSFNIAKTYFTSITIFISIFAGAALIALLLSYSKISSKDSLNDNTVRSLIYRYILNAGIFILIMTVIGFLLYYIFKLYGNIQSKHSLLSLFINLFIVVVFLSLVYRFFDIGSYLKNSPFFQLIYNVIMYVPCLLIYLIETPVHYLIPSSITKDANSSMKDMFNNEYSKTNIGSFLLLLIMIILLFIYLFFPFLTEKIQLQGGKQITNQTIYTNKQADLFTLQQLTNMTTPDYQYGLSFWLYIDSEPPSTSNLYLSNGSVVNFAETPNILYNGTNNSLIFMQKYSRPFTDFSNIDMSTFLNSKGFNISTNPNEINTLNRSNTRTAKEGKNYMRDASNNIIHFDKNGNREIFRLENIQLQKWNHIALNLYNGTMDIFYNGQLVKSQPGVVPWIDVTSLLTIGSDNGISGGICNMTFFNKPLNYSQIYYLYELFKNKTPPITYSNFNKTVVFVPSNNNNNTNKKSYTNYGSDTNTTILTQSPAIMPDNTSNNKTKTAQNTGNIPTPYVMAPPFFTRLFNSIT